MKILTDKMYNEIVNRLIEFEKTRDNGLILGWLTKDQRSILSLLKYAGTVNFGDKNEY